MGDVRFERAYRKLVEADDRASAIRSLSDEEVIAAMAAAREGQDPYLANILASEAMNRVRRKGTIVETAVEGLLTQTPDGYLTYLNPAAERMLGWHLEEVVGEPVHHLFHHTHGDGTPFLAEDCPIRRVGLTGQSVDQFETLLWRKDGTSFPAEQNAAPIIRDGDIEGVVITFVDITERVRANQALRESEAMKSAILLASLDVIITMDAEGRVVEWNPAAERTFGYRAEEALGRLLADLIIPPRYRDAHHRGLAHYLETGEGPILGQRLDLPAVRRDGTEFPAELAIVPIQAGPRPLFTGYLRDITDRKRAEEALRASEERFRKLFASNPLPTWVFDAETLRFLDVNEAAVRKYGWTREEFLTRRVSDIRPPEDLARFQQYMADQREGLRQAGEWRHLTKEGAVIDVEVATYHTDFAGRPAVIVVSRDITHRKQAEREREALLERERAARHAAERAERRARLLAEAASRLSSNQDYGDALQEVTELTVPALADWCVFHVLDA
ncbi:MAG TPA: PAS domain S-box protein, partial [Candidatus Thermoplasmatota archaeon]|nr:PAS domain S-box protein [Candidatus Thermoplasmatota archaeon]